MRVLTKDEIIARYGPPRTVQPRERDTMWYYHDEESGQPLSVQIKLVDDLVTGSWMEP